MKELDVSHAAKFEKKTFSMFVPEVETFLKEKNLKTIVLFGVEVGSYCKNTVLICKVSRYDMSFFFFRPTCAFFVQLWICVKRNMKCILSLTDVVLE